MNNTPLITLFEENELNIATLYSLYAQKIPAKKAFWERLSDEEIKHAAQIGSKKNITDVIEESKFFRGIMSYIINFVLEETKRAQQNNVGHRDALLTALRIEQSMLEKKCFDLLIPTNKTVKEVFNKLNSGTESHVEDLLKEVKKNKFSLK